MFSQILITLGLVLIIVGVIGLIVTTVENVKFNDNSVKNKTSTILTGSIFFFGTLFAAAGGALLL